MSRVVLGYLTKSAVACHLGCERAELDRMIREDDLPVVKLPGATRPKVKIHPYALYVWEEGLSCGEFPKYEVWVQGFGGS